MINDYDRLTTQEWRDLHDRQVEHIASLQKRLEAEIKINSNYREWFTKHKNWVEEHSHDFALYLKTKGLTVVNSNVSTVDEPNGAT